MILTTFTITSSPHQAFFKQMPLLSIGLSTRYSNDHGERHSVYFSGRVAPDKYQQCMQISRQGVMDRVVYLTPPHLPFQMPFLNIT